MTKNNQASQTRQQANQAADEARTRFMNGVQMAETFRKNRQMTEFVAQVKQNQTFKAEAEAAHKAAVSTPWN